VLTGSCLCKGVRYEVDRLAGAIGHCHCHTCRKAHAAAFASTARVDREHFRWVSGEDLIRAYESTPGKLRRFCSRCGSQLIAEWVAQTQVILRVATLDDDPGVKPMGSIWRSHDVPWLAHGPELRAFPEAAPTPPSR